jgi:tetratricopeptide (TPR) repeat protein
LAENTTHAPVLGGSLRERPLPRLLQQLHRKKFTGHFVIADQTRDESEVYLRQGAPGLVQRPVETDRLDHMLVELGVLPADVVARASAQVGDGLRLGDVLERMGALDKQRLAPVLKTQLVRKLSRLFFVGDGTFTVYATAHAYGEGGEFAAMRVDPRSIFYNGLRAAYDLRRVTRELGYLAGHRFRLADISPSFIAAMGLPPDDATVLALRQTWLTLEDLDRIAGRPIDTRTAVLALYYSDVLVCESLARDGENPQTAESGQMQLPTPVPAAKTNSMSKQAQAPAPASATSASKPAASSVAAVSTSASPARASASPMAKPTVAQPAARTAAAGSAAPAEASVARAPQRPQGAAGSDEATRTLIVEMDKRLGSLTHFELLGVSPNASSDEVGTAFLRAARQFHPDRLAGGKLQDLQPAAERILARINEAAMVLGNTVRKADYIASLAVGLKSSQTSLPTVLEGENQFLRGEAHLKKGEYGKAIEAFTLAVRGNPSEPQYRAYLAWARFEDPTVRKETVATETLHVLENVVKERPKFARGHYWLGLIWKSLNESDRAGQAFRMATAADASLIEASRELRLIEMRKQKADSDKPDSARGFTSKLFKR